MMFIALSVLCVSQLFLSAETVPNKEETQKEIDTIWEGYGWFTMETTVILAIVVVGISVAISTTFCGGTVGNVFSGILSFVAVVLVLSAKAITNTVSVLVSVVREIVSKNNSSNESKKTSEPTELDSEDEKKKTFIDTDSESCESLLNDIKKLTNSSSSPGEKESAKKMLEILKLLEEIDGSLGKEEK